MKNSTCHGAVPVKTNHRASESPLPLRSVPAGPSSGNAFVSDHTQLSGAPCASACVTCQVGGPHSGGTQDGHTRRPSQYRATASASGSSAGRRRPVATGQPGRGQGKAGGAG